MRTFSIPFHYLQPNTPLEAHVKIINQMNKFAESNFKVYFVDISNFRPSIEVYIGRVRVNNFLQVNLTCSACENFNPIELTIFSNPNKV